MILTSVYSGMNKNKSERNEILASILAPYDGDITGIIRTISKRSEPMTLLIYDFIREFYEHAVPTKIIGMLDACKIYLECKNVTIPEEGGVSRGYAFRPILDEEVPWNHKEQAEYMSKIYAWRHTYIMT